MRMIRIKYCSLNVLVLILFVVDRILKYYFIKNPAIKFGGDFISGIFSFHFEKNTGIAFGISVNQFILAVLVIIIILILIRLVVKAYFQKDLLLVTSLTLIIVGAISNLIDRLRFGFVIDYIDVSFFTVFNLADAMITCGVGILVINILFQKRLDKK